MEARVSGYLLPNDLGVPGAHGLVWLRRREFGTNPDKQGGAEAYKQSHRHGENAPETQIVFHIVSSVPVCGWGVESKGVSRPNFCLSEQHQRLW